MRTPLLLFALLVGFSGWSWARAPEEGAVSGPTQPAATRLPGGEPEAEQTPATKPPEDDQESKSYFDMSLEELLSITVEAPSKKEELARETSSIVITISSREIEDFGANNLLELLERTASVYYLGSYLQPQNVVSIRGDLPVHYNVHVLVLINGRPTRDVLWGGIDFPIFHSFPLDTIDRIEIIRGPGSVLYGTNAYSGVINIVTKRPKHNSSKISFGYGGFDAFSLSGASFVSAGDLQVTAGIKYFKDRGWDFRAMDEPANAADTPESINAQYSQNNIGANLGLDFKGFRFDALAAFSSMSNLGVVPSRVMPGSAGRCIQLAEREGQPQHHRADASGSKPETGSLWNQPAG